MEQILKIEKLVHGGLGLTRTGNGVVFVSGTLPGETVRVSIDASVGGRPFASCLEIIEPSPFRRPPPCPHAGVCGGCDWLHISYDRQLSIKEEIFKESLARTGRLKDLPAVAVLASPEFGYRSRVQIKIDRAAKTAGFFKKKSNEVVPVSRCPLLCDSLNSLLSSLPMHLASLPRNTTQLKAIAGTLRQSTEGKPVLSTIASSPVVKGVTMVSTTVRVEPYDFFVPGDGFFQSNRFIAGALGRISAEWLAGNVFCDIFGGVGFFSVFVAQRFTSGILIDNEKKHVAAAQKNFAQNGISRVSSFAKTAAQFVETARQSAKRPDCIIVDPPRTGLEPRVRSGIAGILPRTLLYVSCDPATQARDAGFFVNKCGYRLEKAALFDFYPQTHHLETVLLLRR